MRVAFSINGYQSNVVVPTVTNFTPQTVASGVVIALNGIATLIMTTDEATKLKAALTEAGI